MPTRLEVGVFGLEILVEGVSLPIEDRRVRIRHGQEYQIGLRNNGDVMAVVALSIDGKSVGNFQVGAQSAWAIERPEQEARRFTAMFADSKAAQDAGVVSQPMNGVIKAIFTPSFPPVTDASLRRGGLDLDAYRCPASGRIATVLGAKSSQQFIAAPHGPLDDENACPLTLCLIQDIASSIPASTPAGIGAGADVPSAAETREKDVTPSTSVPERTTPPPKWIGQLPDLPRVDCDSHPRRRSFYRPNLSTCERIFYLVFDLFNACREVLSSFCHGHRRHRD